MIIFINFEDKKSYYAYIKGRNDHVLGIVEGKFKG